jgi:hypothetical protein
MDLDEFQFRNRRSSMVHTAWYSVYCCLFMVTLVKPLLPSHAAIRHNAGCVITRISCLGLPLIEREQPAIFYVIRTHRHPTS